MIEKFLTAKHWQFFLVTYGIPTFLYFFLVGTMISGLSNGQEPELDSILGYLRFVPIIIGFLMFFYFGWFWSVGVGLNDKIPENIRPNVKRFKFVIISMIVYFVVFAAFIIFAIKGISQDGSDFNFSLFAFILPFHFLMMLCMIYILYFVAKTIKTAELQRKLTFGDFFGEFLACWFLAIGIWFIQPTINRIYKEDHDEIL